MARTPQQTFEALTQGVASLIGGDLSEARRLAELYSVDTLVSFPLHPQTPPLTSRQALEQHFQAVGSSLSTRVKGLRAENVRLHHGRDPEVIMAEFDYVMEGLEGTVTVSNLFVMRVRNGEIVESRDYTGKMP